MPEYFLPGNCPVFNNLLKAKINMKIGFIGLGKMGGKMVERLLNDGHQVVGLQSYPKRGR